VRAEDLAGNINAKRSPSRHLRRPKRTQTKAALSRQAGLPGAIIQIAKKNANKANRARLAIRAMERLGGRVNY